MARGAGGIRGRPALLSVSHTARRCDQREFSVDDGGYGAGPHRDEGVSDEVSRRALRERGCLCRI